MIEVRLGIGSDYLEEEAGEETKSQEDPSILGEEEEEDQKV